MKANLVKMNIIPVNKPEPKLQTLQSITTGGGQSRLISTIVKQEDDSDDIKPVTTKPAKVHDVKDLISKASETNIKRENNDSIVTIPPPLTAPPGGGDISKDFNRLAPNISSSSTCDSKHSDLNVIKPNTTTTHSSSSKQESLTSKSTSSKVKSSNEHHSSRSSHHHDSDRKSSSKHSHRHDKHHSSSSSASKHHHSSSNKKVVNTGVQCDELPKPLSESCSTKPSLPPSSLVGGIAPVRHRMFGMMGANPLTNVENSNYKYGHLMYVER